MSTKKHFVFQSMLLKRTDFYVIIKLQRTGTAENRNPVRIIQERKYSMYLAQNENNSIQQWKLPKRVLRETVNSTGEISIETFHQEQGILCLTSEITYETANQLMMNLLYTAKKALPLKLMINSGGGSVEAGLIIRDMLQSYPYPVEMYCTGIAASMAAIIFSSGQKGRRFILPHARVMIHEPHIAGGFNSSASNLEKAARSIMEVRNTLNMILAENTGQPLEVISEAVTFDCYMKAEQAIEFGLCDEIKNIF